MSRFGDDPLQFFNSVYQQTAPWDIGAPQPALMDLLRRYPPFEPVLDAGCGTGDIALAIAEMGYNVVGADFVKSAVALAEENKKKLLPEIAARAEFIQADVFHPKTLKRKFGSVVDSGFYHLFNEQQGREYLQNAASVIKPNGRLYMLEFAVDFNIPNIPRAVTIEEMESVLMPGNGWRILEICEAKFESRISPVPAIALCAERI